MTLLASGLAAVALFVRWRMLPANRLRVRIDYLLGSPSAGTHLNYHLPHEAIDEIRARGTNASLLRNLDCFSGKPRLHGLVATPWTPNWIWSRYREYLQRRSDRARAVADAFGALGPAAADAIPELVKRLGRPATAQSAAFCLSIIEPRPAMVVTNLLMYLQSTNAKVRSAAGLALVCIDPDAATEAGLQ